MAAASRSVSITYVPADCGSIIPGKSKAPKAFQDVGISSRLRDAGIFIVSEHDALEIPARYESVKAVKSGSQGYNVRNEDLNVSVCHDVYRTIAQNLDTSSTSTSKSTPTRATINKEHKQHKQQAPSFQLILGGECCISPAILSAFWKHADLLSPPKRVGLIYIDADADLASPMDPGSGTFASMNMTHLVRADGALESMKPFTRPMTGEPACDASNTVLFGTNLFSTGNKREHLAYLFDHSYKVMTSTSLAREPKQRATEAVKYLEDKGVDVILVHLDVDAIDPTAFPLANVPNFTGVSFEQMMQALAVFLASPKVGALTIAEVNPDHDPSLAMVEKLTSRIVAMLAARHDEGGG